ncbi:DUF4132 domain-containing protein [Actinospica robiniae]|uniref:DUF4132 domain-containing protein n=1 Tax=Actinospica robiniae TaxID=304901 RepID=UPI0012FAE9C7|nr:DUF4132 domain-containing protein [Actinospica robiniae]
MAGAPGGGLLISLIPGDGWSLAVAKSGLLVRSAESKFEELLTLAADPRPSASKSWAAEVRMRALAEKSAPRKLRALLSALATAPPGTAPTAAGARGADARPILVGRENTIVAVNTVAAAAHVLGEDAIPDLGKVLCRLMEEPWTADSTSIRDACSGALTAIGTEAAFEELKAAVPRAQTKAQREMLLLCLSRMPWSAKDARAAGASMAELVVPAHGLDAAGRRELTAHHRNFELALREDGSVSRRTLDDAEVVENAAADRVLRAETRAISATYRKEIARVEALLATEHSWSSATWRKLYLDHPITRAVASRLIWRLTLDETAGGAATGQPSWTHAGPAAINDARPDAVADAGNIAGTSARTMAGGHANAEATADTGAHMPGARPRIGFPFGAGARSRSHAAGSPVGRTVDVIPAWNPVGLLRVINAQQQSTDATFPWPDGVVSVQLWHPREAAPEDLAAWRVALRGLPFDQPFQQIERDFVASESDPEKTEFDQFVGEVTDTSSWETALAELPWAAATKAGGKTSDREDLVHREFPGEKVTATAMFTRLTTPVRPLALADALPDRIRLGAAWIHRTDDKNRTPLPLSAVSARLVSEVERDLHVLMSPATDVAAGLLHRAHTATPDDGPTDAVPE